MKELLRTSLQSAVIHFLSLPLLRRAMSKAMIIVDDYLFVCYLQLCLNVCFYY